MQEYQVAGRRFGLGESFQEQRQFKMPIQGIHTFSARHNKLDCLIHVQLEMAGWPALAEEYLLHVPAEVQR